PVAGPGADVVGPERTALERHLDAVVEPSRELAGDPHAGGRFRERAEAAGFGAQVHIALEEDVGLDCGLRNQLRAGAIDAGEAVAGAALVELTVEDADDRRREDIRGEDLRPEGGLDAVERARRVQPADVSDEPLLTVDELLAAGANRDRSRRCTDVC